MFPRAAHHYSDRDRNMDLCESYRFFHDNTCDENTVFFDILAQMFPPKVGYISSIWDHFWYDQMSLLGSFVGGVLAIPFAILASSNLIKNKLWSVWSAYF